MSLRGDDGGGEAGYAIATGFKNAMSAFSFVFRHFIAWGVVFAIAVSILSSFDFLPGFLVSVFILAMLGAWLLQMARVIVHVRRIRLLHPGSGPLPLAIRQQRTIDLPVGAEMAFGMLEAAVRELPRARVTESARDSLQLFATVPRRIRDQGEHHIPNPRHRLAQDHVSAQVVGDDEASSIRLLCEPATDPWMDLLFVDDGANIENADAIARALNRRVRESRRQEREEMREVRATRELALARLNLLNAQVEPHFLYNTLASAQLLTRSAPAKADEMLGNLITYLRRSLPQEGNFVAPLAREVERARSYLEIMKVRMGERLNIEIDVPLDLEGIRLPAMMLQTLVENAIRHGLEPREAGGTVWINARGGNATGKVTICVADDGEGLREDSSGTGVGLRNITERLALTYGDTASLRVTANIPRGIVASIEIPREIPTEDV
jgi:signal transduction histidine kinase